MSNKERVIEIEITVICGLLAGNGYIKEAIRLDEIFKESTLPKMPTEEEIDQILKDNLIQGTYGIITSRAAKAILKLLR